MSMPDTMAPSMPGKQVARPKGTTTSAQGFLEYLPPGYEDGVPRPLLLFLHGFGENGNGSAGDLNKLPFNGPPRLISQGQWPASRPFIVLSPQHGGGDCQPAGEVDAFLTWALANYRVDTKRVYITGLSCGAYGLWDYLGNKKGQVVTAVVPICGDGRGAWNKAKCGLGEVAIWGFHGDADPQVPVAGTRDAMNNIIACPMPPRKEAKVTIYPGVGHDSWGRTYDGSAGHDIYGWLLSHSR
jgi:predicted peptidase